LLYRLTVLQFKFSKWLHNYFLSKKVLKKDKENTYYQ
jgi:hypothetical protein